MKTAATALLSISLCLLSGSAVSGRFELMPDGPVKPVPDGANSERTTRVKEVIQERKAACATEVSCKFALLEALRADLASPWTSLVIAHQYECSCTGVRPGGFELVRNQGAVTISQWGDPLWYQFPMVSRTVSEEELEYILLALPAHFLTAMMIDDPMEAAVPQFVEGVEDPGWEARLIGAGGYPFERSDRHGIQIRVDTHEGLKTYIEHVDDNHPFEFYALMHRIRTGKAATGSKL